MREFLSDNDVPFVDRNIRQSEAFRAELAARTDALVVPQLFWRGCAHRGVRADRTRGPRHRVPAGLELTRPPGNSLESSQGGKVVEPGETIEDGLRALLSRLAEEIAFNEAKGTAPYRLGMHDGLRFAEDAVADILRRHGHDARTDDRAIDA